MVFKRQGKFKKRRRFLWSNVIQNVAFECKDFLISDTFSNVWLKFLHAPHEFQYYWRMQHNAYHKWRCHILHGWWAQNSLLGYFVERHLRLQRAKKCVCRLDPFLHSAASTKTKKETQHRDVFSQKRVTVTAHLLGMQPTLTAKKDPLKLRRNSNILLLLLNFHYNSVTYFNCCAYIRIRI